MLSQSPNDLRILLSSSGETAQALNKAGILTFKQLGLMDQDVLVKKLGDLGLPSSNAASWQEGALLAAAGNWEKLDKLQNK